MSVFGTGEVRAAKVGREGEREGGGGSNLEGWSWTETRICYSHSFISVHVNHLALHSNQLLNLGTAVIASRKRNCREVAMGYASL